MRNRNNAGRVVSLTRIISAWVCVGFLLLTACARVGPQSRNADEEVREQWGIEITGLSMSAGGHMIDFRYRVLDAKKAEPLFAREHKAYLIDEASKKVLSVPTTAKVGPLRTTGDVKEGRIYWMFFGNIPGLVKSGSKVTVVIGDFRAENLVVQ